MKTDVGASKVTVTGKVDPAGVKEHLEKKIGKKVELISPQPKKDGSDNKKAEEKPSEKKPAEEKKPVEDKKPKQVWTPFSSVSESIMNSLFKLRLVLETVSLKLRSFFLFFLFFFFFL